MFPKLNYNPGGRSMSLAIVFKGTEGIVLAVDSRVTLTAQLPHKINNLPVMIPSTFDNATKLLYVAGQPYVGAVTFGVGAFGQKEPRTAYSFMPEFEAELSKDKVGRLSVKAFADKLGEFFMRKWDLQGMPKQVEPGNSMVFYVAGYDDGETYGHIYELQIPTAPAPKEWHAGQFGVVYGGQHEFVSRLLSGFDPQLGNVAQEFLKFPEEKKKGLEEYLKAKLQASIPYQFLPLQDCINLAILLIRATMTIQTFLVGVRGVGGKIDVIAITRTEGVKNIQLKEPAGEGNE
jgi:hypothetical protein